MAPQFDLTRKNFKQLVYRFLAYERREDIYDIITDLRGIEDKFFTGEDGIVAKEGLEAMDRQKDRMPIDEIRTDIGFILTIIMRRLNQLHPAEHGGRRRTRSRRPLSRRISKKRIVR